MKILGVLLAALFSVSMISAQAPAPAKSDAKPDTKVEAKAPAKKVEKKVEKEPVIPGVTIRRPNGTFLGLEIVDTKFKLTFYDKKKKVMPPDVTRVAARWPNTRSGTPSDFRTVLNPSGEAMVGTRPVLPPLIFNVYLTLLKGEGDDAEAVETYTVPFRG